MFADFSAARITYPFILNLNGRQARSRLYQREDTMMRPLRLILKATFASLLFSAVSPSAGAAQAEALLGLLGNATDFDFYRTWTSIPKGQLKPERGERIAGVGFELVFDIPGGMFPRRRIVPKASREASGDNCEARFQRAKLEQDSTCADTTYTLKKRLRVQRVITYEDEAKVEEFDWSPPLIQFELGVGFSQSGALVAREATTEMRASMREAPSVTLYGNFGSGPLGGYLGARTGLVSLEGGRAYIGVDSSATEFGGSTFQIGPVAGAALSYRGVHLFAEAAYMWRDIKSIEWADDKNVGAAPRSANLTGAAFAVGAQFRFKDKD